MSILIILAFMTVFTLRSTCFHCTYESHQQTHSHNHEESTHEDCSAHLHTNCSMTLFVVQLDNKLVASVPDAIVFTEYIDMIKPGPVLDGPFQPPRLS